MSDYDYEPTADYGGGSPYGDPANYEEPTGLAYDVATAAPASEAPAPYYAPQTADEYKAARVVLANASRAAAESPGAAQFFAQQAQENVNEIVGQIAARTESLGGVPLLDAPAAFNHATGLFEAKLRTLGTNPDEAAVKEAETWAYGQAAKKAAGRRTYKDVADEASVRGVGRGFVSQRKQFDHRS